MEGLNFENQEMFILFPFHASGRRLGFYYCMSKKYDPFYKVSYYIRWVTTSWTYSKYGHLLGILDAYASEKLKQETTKFSSKVLALVKVTETDD